MKRPGAFPQFRQNDGQPDSVARLIAPVRQIVRAHAPRCSICDEFHNVDTAMADWRSGVLGFRHADGWLIHGEPCSYGDAITARYGTNAQLHERVAALEEDQ